MAARRIGRAGRLQYFHSSRADLLRRLDRIDEARDAYRRALELTGNATERAFLAGRLASLSANGAGGRATHAVAADASP